jgi:hypothetical protein
MELGKLQRVDRVTEALHETAVQSVVVLISCAW